MICLSKLKITRAEILLNCDERSLEPEEWKQENATER
jgi:hypothetical protein